MAHLSRFPIQIYLNKLEYQQKHSTMNYICMGWKALYTQNETQHKHACTNKIVKLIVDIVFMDQ